MVAGYYAWPAVSSSDGQGWAPEPQVQSTCLLALLGARCIGTSCRQTLGGSRNGTVWGGAAQ